MTAKFVTYADSGEMSADLFQPTGTYAQLMTDILAHTYQNYQFNGTSWLTSTDVLYGATVPYLFGQVSTTGPATTLLSSPIDDGLVHLISDGFCLADTIKDESQVINAIGAALEARGGGKIIFDACEPGNFYNIYEFPILLFNNVTYEGVGPASHIRNTRALNDINTTNACFQGNGVTQKTYQFMTAYAVADITANNEFVTLTNHPDAGNMAPGSVYLIFTSGPAGSELNGIGGTNLVPFFSRQYRCLTSDATSGIVTLDFPIPVNIANSTTPMHELYIWITDATSTSSSGKYGGVPTRLVDGAIVRNVRLSAVDPVDGKTFTGGNYQGLYENIWCDGTKGLMDLNCMSRCTIRNLYGTFGQIAFEFATGSHDSIVDGVNAAYFPPDYASPTMRSSVIDLAEYTANTTIQNFNIDASKFQAPGMTEPTFYSINQGSGHRLRNGRVRMLGKGFGVASQMYVVTDDILVENVDFELMGQSHNFGISAGNLVNIPCTNIRQRNVRYYGDTPSANSVVINQSFSGSMENVDFGPGTIAFDSGTTMTGPIRNCGIGGWDINNLATDMNNLNLRGSTRSGSDGFYAARQSLVNVVIGTVTGVAGTASNASAVVTAMSTTVGILVGDAVTVTAGAPTIPGGTTVVSVDSTTQVTLSANFTVAGMPASTTLKFAPLTAMAAAKYQLPAGQVVARGDKFITEFAMSTGTSTVNTKLLSVADDGGVLFTITVASGDTGIIQGVVESTIQDHTTVYIAWTVTYPVGSTSVVTTGRVTRNGIDILMSGRNYTLSAWVGGAGPVLTFYSIDMRFKDYGE